MSETTGAPADMGKWKDVIFKHISATTSVIFQHISATTSFDDVFDMFVKPTTEEAQE